MKYQRVLRTVVLCVALFNFYPSAVSSQTIQKGKTTFYSRRATGARTANGERLHHDSMTCAHRTLPFGTMLRVKNPANGREVIVRVNDRGPYIKGRVLDLSWGAAKKLGIIAQGVAMVEIERIGAHVPKRVPFRMEEEPAQLPDLELVTTSSLYDEWQERIRQRNSTPSEELKSNKFTEENAGGTPSGNMPTGLPIGSPIIKK